MYRLTLAHIWVLLFGLVMPAVCDEPIPGIAPQNPDYLEYISRRELQATTDSGYSLGLVPSPVDLRHLTGLRVFRSLSQTLPSSYDLRTFNRVTAVRNQSSCGSCWAFAAYGSLESSLRPAETADFSENNLKNLSGFDASCCSGGDHLMCTAYLARWAGPVNEVEEPYNPSSCSSPSGLLPSKHLQRAMFIPDRANSLDNDTLKQAVMTYGAVYTTFFYSDSYYSASNASYYCSPGGVANHAVCIVGWDDNYSKTKFLAQPPGDGAFIAKNSWGTGWGQSGYFYVSYYDAAFGRNNAVFAVEPSTNYSHIYQYDPLGWVGSFGYGNSSAGFANVFTAISSDPLVAVSFYTVRPNSSYTIKVYLDPVLGPTSTSGPVLTQSGSVEVPGYSTVVLDQAVPLTAGRKFSVAVWMTSPGYGYPVAVEYRIPGYSTSASSNSGESYVSSSGTSWSDILVYEPYANVCLKAFSSGGPALSVSPETDLSSSGTAGGPFSPSSQTYTLTNTGSTPLTWAASPQSSNPWIGVSPSSGTLDAGQSADVSVSINASAGSLAAGSYHDEVTFTNSSNGVGNTTRAVNLTVAAPSLPAMVVTPEDGLTASGRPGGPFSPASLTYTVANTSDALIDFSVTHNIGDNWLTIGYRVPAHTATQIVTAVNALANSLSPGVYSDTVTFTNLTNGQGNTTRQMQLTVVGGQLSVSPADAFAAFGSQGGPFSPSEKLYTLTNSGAAALSWTASHNQSASWLSLSPESGTIAAGASTTVRASITASANGLAGGDYSDTITFANVTDGRGNTTRNAHLTVYSGRLVVTPVDGFVSNGLPGGPFSPVSRQYTLSNPGNSPVDWTVSHGPGVTWLDISQTSGTLAAGGTATLTVAIKSSAASLEAGAYSDTLSFVNTTNGVGSTTRPVILTVASRSLTSLDVIPATLSCPSNDPRQLHAIAGFSDSTSSDITSAAQWSSSAGSVATVDSSGVVTPVSAGNATITCSYALGGVAKTSGCQVNVKYRAFSYLYLSPSGFTFYGTSPVQFKCQARVADGWIDVTEVCSWTSSDPSIAVVDYRGLVTPLKNGACYIKAAYMYNGVLKTTQGKVTVQGF
jgi:C1A family cysteine protease